MKFIELTERFWNGKEYINRGKFLMDFQSGWEIYDKGGTEPANWVNQTSGTCRTTMETYIEIKYKLYKAGLLVDPK